MTRATSDDITKLLIAWRCGDSAALDALVPLVDGELRRIARGRLAFLRRILVSSELCPSLETTTLISEAYLRLLQEDRDWQNRAHFFAIAAHRMRNICHDYARRVRATKRGGAAKRVGVATLSGIAPAAAAHTGIEEILDLTMALERLEALDPRQAKVVEMKYFGGLTEVETADVLGVSQVTVKRDWRMARAWLHRELQGSKKE